MKKIKIEGIEGYYYVEDNYLCHSCNNYEDDVLVEDLTCLYVYQYNELVEKLNKHYPKYPIDFLEGRFI